MIFRLPAGNVSQQLLRGWLPGVAVVSVLVLWPQLVIPIVSGNWVVAVPLALGLLLVFRLVPSLSRVGNISMAYLVACA